MRCGVLKVFQTHANEKRAVVKRLSFNQLLQILSNVQQAHLLPNTKPTENFAQDFVGADFAGDGAKQR